MFNLISRVFESFEKSLKIIPSMKWMIDLQILASRFQEYGKAVGLFGTAFMYFLHFAFEGLKLVPAIFTHYFQ